MPGKELSSLKLALSKSRAPNKKSTLHKPRPMSFPMLMLIGTALSWSLVAGVISTTEFQRDYLTSLIQVFVVMGMIGAILSHKYLIRMGLVLFSCFFLFVLSGFLFVSETPHLANQFADLLTMTIRYIGGIESHHHHYESLIVWVITIVISLFVVIFIYYRSWIIPLFIITAISFSVLVSSPYFSYPYSFYVYLFAILVLLMRGLHQQGSKRAKTPSPLTKFVLPVALICFLLVGFVPVPQPGAMSGPIHNLIVRPFNFLNDSLYNITQRREFSISQVGFGRVSGQLGGAITLNHEDFMRVRGDVIFPLYLTGSTWDTYTGSSWNNTHSRSEPMDFNEVHQNLELLERLSNLDVMESRWFLHEFIWTPDQDIAYAPHPVSGILVPERMREVEGVVWQLDLTYQTLEIDVLHFRPSFVFHPGVLRSVDVEDHRITFSREGDGAVTTNRRLQRNARYTVISNEIHSLPLVNNQPPTFSYRGYLRNLGDRLDSILSVPRNTIVNSTKEMTVIRFNDLEISYGDLIHHYLIPRANQIHEIYTRLPEDFPPAITELAIDVTQGAENNYMKMRLLETYLNENFIYTLLPIAPPGNQDFVEHFLFHTRQGHCVYFATAFVTMARSLGMPARYVEGFLINGRPDEEGFITVRGSMAHAWPEVYFEGYGWHRFEPTPIVGLPQLREIPASGIFDWYYWMNPELWGVDFMYPPEAGTVNWDSNLDSSRGERGDSSFVYFWIFLSLVLGGILIAGTVRVLFIHRRFKDSQEEENNPAIIKAFEFLMLYLKFYNWEMKEGETVYQFMNRVCEETSGNKEDKATLEKVAQIYSKARYGNQLACTDERMLVENTVNTIEQQIRSSLGQPRYYFYRYVLARF